MSGDKPGEPPVGNCNCDGCKSAREKKRKEREKKIQKGEIKRGPEPDEESRYMKRKKRYGDNWQEARERALERDGYECRGCNMTHEEHKQDDSLFPPGKGLHVHHKTKAEKFDSPEEANQLDNLVCLCYDCHQVAEHDVLTLSIL